MATLPGLSGVYDFQNHNATARYSFLIPFEKIFPILGREEHVTDVAL